MLHAAKRRPRIFTRSPARSSIVGYNTKTVEKKNYQEMVGASFNSVGAEALDIQDITLVGDLANGGSWIKWWDPTTRTYSAEALYVNPLCDPNDPTGEAELDYGGWGDEDFFPVSKTFAPGEGFWFGANRDGVGITTAGAIERTSNEYVGRLVEKKNYQVMVINAFPITLNIQNIVLDGDLANGGSWIKWWDPTTRTYSAEALYVNPLCDPNDPTGEAELDYGGWGDEDFFPVTKTFAPGEGLWFGANRDNVTICFPNPFYEAE